MGNVNTLMAELADAVRLKSGETGEDIHSNSVGLELWSSRRVLFRSQPLISSMSLMGSSITSLVFSNLK